MKYKLVVFDFDGTIADTSEGILDAHRFALKSMGREIPEESILRSVIGGNLLATYKEKFGFADTEARKAVELYRKRYAKEGIYKAQLYDGFEKMLQSLKDSGAYIGVATLKAEKFANIMLRHMDISQYFDYICGMDENDTLDKAALIKKCMKHLGCKQIETVLVGDSFNDLKGAEIAGVDFIAVSYGFGFKNSKNYEFKIVNTTKELFRALVKA